MNINNIIVISILTLGVQISHADTTDETSRSHRGILFQPVSAFDRLKELSSTQDRRGFMNTRMGQNSMGNSDMRNKMQSMPDKDRQAFRESMGGVQGGSGGMNRGGMGSMNRGGMSGRRGRH